VEPRPIAAPTEARLIDFDALDFESRRVFIRLDLDVEPDDEAAFLRKLRTPVATILRASEAGAQVILAGHRSPKAEGQSAPSLEDAGAHLAGLLKKEIFLPDDCLGDAAKKLTRELRDGQICLLENLLRHDEEKTRDWGFATELRSYVDIYVFEALAAAELEFTSTVELPRTCLERSIGLGARRELEVLNQLRNASLGPLCVLLGGTNVDDQLNAARLLVHFPGTLCIGGPLGVQLAVAERGASAPDPALKQRLAECRTLLDAARDSECRLLVTSDVVRSGANEEAGSVDLTGPLAHLDVGPDTRRRFAKELGRAERFLLMGALGSTSAGAQSGTAEIWEKLPRGVGLKVGLGDETCEALESLGADLESRLDFVSSSGKVGLHALSGRRLPALAAVDPRG
jgi:phosphoglycerate kinase